MSSGHCFIILTCNSTKRIEVIVIKDDNEKRNLKIINYNLHVQMQNKKLSQESIGKTFIYFHK